MIVPYTWIVRISLLSSFREANRFTELGLVPAVLLAAAAVNWLRDHAKPALIAVFALAILEAGSVGAFTFPQIIMPTALPALDRPIAADHSGVDCRGCPVRRAQRRAAARRGSRLRLRCRGADHRRRPSAHYAYISRLPESTLAAVKRHPFYADLLKAQDEPGVLHAALLAGPADPAWLQAARVDARRINVGWAIVWSPSSVILDYLQAVGLRFDYRADGALVYRMAPGGQAGHSTLSP
jgi:hypothetical protein